MINIDWKPNKDGDLALYKQIVNFIKDRIASGEWSVGMKLPTQRYLAQSFDVNRSTIVEAFDELKAEGLLAGYGKAGTKIVSNSWSLIASTPPPNWQTYVSEGIYKPNKPTIQAINKLEFLSDTIRLGTGELSPELYPKDIMKQALANIADEMDSLGYEEPRGSLTLRKALSNKLKDYGIDASADSILIVSGSLQALQLISIGILHPNSKVLLESPSYLKSLHIFESVGMKLKGIKMDNRGILVQEVLENKSKSNTTILYTIPTFQNPTGNTMDLERRRELLSICENNRIPIIEDDVYRELSLEEEPPKPLKAFDKTGNVLYLGSMSKSFAPGLRIGWLVGPQTVIERLGDIKMQLDYGASSLSQKVVAELISSGAYDRYITNLKKELKERRDLTLRLLEEHFTNIAFWNKPKGGFYIWVKLRYNISISKLFEEAIKENILINPGNVYDFDNDEYIRISYSYATKEELEHGLLKLSQLIVSQTEA